MLFNKKREEFVTFSDETRISYSWDDVLVEDFYKSKGHPYAVFDMDGVLLKANLDGGPGCLYTQKSICNQGNAS